MIPSRFVPQSSAIRKSRLEGTTARPSLLPKPRQRRSTDRLSSEARRPSTGYRSSSAEPARATFANGRLSREASATKLPLNGRSRSQQGERFGHSNMTPLRSSHYTARNTTTPVRTPSEERASRSWQASLDRALAFVTIKDQRAISSAAWQRGEMSRAAALLAERGAGAGALLRPLTIARFVDIVGGLLAALVKDARLNTDNYVTKLPHISKRLLYPGVVSKSWLKTVNTLHAFPHALALIVYLLDLVSHIEMPVSDEWLYVGKDDLSRLRRDYLNKCWIRFQDPDPQFEDLNELYLQDLRQLLGNDEEKIAELQQVIKKYESCLEDEAEVAARLDERRLVARRDELHAALRAERAARRDLRAQCDLQRTRAAAAHAARTHLERDLERASAQNEELQEELEKQPLSVEERTRLLDEVDYGNRVQDSKRALADQLSKMLLAKETELALWQKKTLGACVEYKQGLIHLTPQFPELTELAIDEKELMEARCAEAVGGAVEALRARGAALAEAGAQAGRARAALARRTQLQLEETRAKISELKEAVEREAAALEAERAREASDVTACGAELRSVSVALEELRARQDHYDALQADLHFWEKQLEAWQTKLEAMREYIKSKRIEAPRLLAEATQSRVLALAEQVAAWNQAIAD